jgi:hypothetical protein
MPRRRRIPKKKQLPNSEELERIKRFLFDESESAEQQRYARADFYFMREDVVTLWHSVADELMPHYSRDEAAYGQQKNCLYNHRVFSTQQVKELFGIIDAMEYAADFKRIDGTITLGSDSVH